MGKDQELIDAARKGDITLLEKILNQRGKRSGPLASFSSLRRGPGANIQDSAGYSPLHHASLNGHTECVRLLLMHDASANLPDSRGSSPLHLAAWAGHQDIVKLLLTHANRPANPNLQTIDNETPLHCAAQHGHTGALTTLLAHGANPNMMNNRGEKPLDLAAQYGRLQVVQMLVRAHPELLNPYKKHYDRNRTIFQHTPLHLASRNGHKHVVEVLLTAGVDVNLVTDSGSALHEASLTAKESVVKTLLNFGADLDVRDSSGATVLKLLKQFPEHVTRGIVSVIKNYQNSALHGEQEDILKVSRSIQSRESYYDEQSYHSKGMRESHAWSSYSNDASSLLESPSSSVGSLDPASPRMRAGGDNNGGFYVTMTPLNNSNAKVSPTPPKKPPRRNLSISPSTSKSLISARSNMSGSSSQTSPYEYLCMAQSGDKKTAINKAASVDQCQSYVKMMSPAAKQKHEAVLKEMSKHLLKSADNLDDEESTTAAPLRSYNPNRKLRRIRDNYDYSQNGSRNSYGNSHNDNGDHSTPMSPSSYRQPPTPDHPPPTAQIAEKVILERIRPLSQEYRRSIAMLEYIRNSQNGTATFGGYENRHRVNSDKREKRQSVPQPLKQPSSNHHPHRQSYEETVPPPQLYSRSRHRNPNNRDSSLSPCSSDVIMSHSLNASSGSLSSVSSDRSASTDCVEYVTDVPFAGLFKGSTMTLDNPNLIGYGSGNSNSDYKYYQSMASEQQYPQYNKSYRSPANNNQSKRQQSSEVQSQKSLQSHHLPKPPPQYQQRPERPKTLDTQSTSMHAIKSTLNSSQSPINSNQVKNAQSTPISEDELLKSENNRSGKCSDSSVNSRLSVPNASIHAQKLSSGSSDRSAPFDEQEEWKKISEIMANFGTDSDVLQDDAPLNNSNRRRDYQNRAENGRSNSIAGFTFTENNQNRNAMKNSESMNSNVQRRSGSKSPHGQLMNFLYENGLDELSNTLYDNGYDDIDFIKGILDESDLEVLEIKPELRKKLMSAVENDLLTPKRAIASCIKSTTDINKTNAYHSMNNANHEKTNNSTDSSADDSSNINRNNNSYSTIPKQKCLNNDDDDDDDANGTLSVNDWLASIKLTHYSEVFRKHLYTDMERISRIWEIELQAVLEINKIGHRKRILYSVGATPPKNIQKSFEKLTAASNDGTKTTSSQRSSLSISSHDSNKDGVVVEHRPNHRKNRQAPKPPVQQQQILNESKMNNVAESASNLEIRGPSELLLGFPTGLRTQWRHSAEILITSAVKYEVNYLGSTVIKELRGTESTKKSIQKLKKNEKIMGVNAMSNAPGAFPTTAHHNTKRAVFILISYRGVQFIDPQTQGTICEHDVRNINCACQDADDLSHFAYITKDSDQNTHYCHVFNVASMDLATEIILTLGQAFEVAYQIALRKSTPTTPIRSPVNAAQAKK